ncbi:hypothetical protein G9C98_001523 [Cotesia typhae]|uniref:Uncharacterized protein n=1 Tax=Cotesia typhae TaxID=2053667 RepID=A0A8J5R0D0_9HYME|nr:hypothetical protein G9C98_001523 [Cotesia typhae]
MIIKPYKTDRHSRKTSSQSLNVIMFNTSLLVFIVVILGTTWAHTIPERVDIVMGSRNLQAENNLQPLQVPNRNDLPTVTKYILGSVTNQTNNKYLMFGHINETHILVPYSYDPRNGVPLNVGGIVNGPSSRPNIIDQARLQNLHEMISNLIQKCEDLKTKLYDLISHGKNVSTLADDIRQIMSIEASLQNQKSSLDDFNNVMRWTPLKKDYFDRDLSSINKEIQELKTKWSIN